MMRSILFCVISILLFSIPIVLCITPTLCQESFEYEDSRPSYTVGKEIKINKPVGLGEGEYTISPKLPAGLKFDTKTGYISGTPAEEAWQYYVIIYNDGKDDMAGCMAAPVINCGATKLTTVALINTIIPCTSPSLFSGTWSIAPSDVKGVSLFGHNIYFKDFNPHKDMKIIVTAINPTGTGSFEIAVEKIEVPELKDGIFVTLYDLATVNCSNFYDDLPAYDHPLTGVMADLNNLTSLDQWLHKMDLFLWGTITTTNGTMDGFIYIENADDYTFYLQTGDEMSARVFIDSEEILSDWRQCNKWNETPLKKTVHLEKGYRRVLVEFMGGKGLDFRLVFDYSLPGTTERKTIPFKYYNDYFNPVMFLESDAVEVSWLYDAFSFTPIRVGIGKAESCWITNNAELPEGSEVTVDGIKGHPQAVMERKEYKVKCKNRDSETNEITLKIRVTETTVHGVRAYYYKPWNFDTTLNTKYGPSVDGVDCLYIQKEEQPFIEETIEQPHPKGLNVEFLDDYGVYWEGYLRPESYALGLSNFRVTADGAYWVYFDHKEVLAKPGRQNIEDPSYFDYELTEDSFYVEIYYVTHNGHAFFDFSMKLNDQSEDMYNNFLPFSYVPVNDYFLMTQSTATYLKGQEVENEAIKVQGFGCSDVVIKPSLPEGLDARCSVSRIMPLVIVGTITDERYIELTPHDITITSTEGNSVSTTIYISVRPVESPDGFYVIDLETGKQYKDTIELVVGKFYDLQFHVESGYVIVFWTEGLPVGFTYNWETSTLSGSPRETLNTKITVDAVVRPEDGENKQFTFGITAKSICENGRMHTFHFSNDFVENGQYLELMVTASNGTKVLDIYESKSVNLPRSYSMCMPVDTYKIYSSGSFDFYFTAYTDGIRIYRYYADFPISSSNSVTINTDPVPPVFKYITHNATYYLGNQILLLPRTETFIDYYTIKPLSLPRGIRFNNITGKIFGTARSIVNATKYTITAVNGKGETPFELTLAVLPDTQEDDCENAGKFLVGLTLYVGKYYDRPGYQLINSNDVVVFDRREGTYDVNSTYRIKMCITPGWYTLRLLDFSRFGWGDSNITISAGNSIIGRYTIENTDNGEKNVTTDFAYLIDTHTEWQYSQEYVENWDKKGSSVSWFKSTIKALAKPTNIPTYYLRYALSFTEYSKYSGYFIRIKHRSGVIVRVNGREIFRDNLPSGDVTPGTPGDTAYDRHKEENFILPIDDLNETAIITYEIHKSSGDDNFPNDDKFFLFPLDGDNDEDCILVTLYGGRVTDSSSKSYGKIPTSSADAAFDLSDSRSWVDYYGMVDGQSYADYSFGSNSHYAFNQFTMISGTGESTGYPMKVSLTGTADKGQVSIGGLDPVEYFTLKKYAPARATFNVDPYTQYKSVRIDIPKSNQHGATDKRMEVREIGYHLCRTKKCPANPNQQLPEGVSNTFYTTNCTTPGSPGEHRYYCSNFGLWIETYSSCTDPPKFINSYTEYTFDAGKVYKDESVYEVTGSPTSYAFECPSCPAGEFIYGLTYDTNTGLISGTAYKSGSYSVKFTAFNKNGQGSITMTLIVKPSNNIIIYKQETYVSLNVSDEIDKQLFWVESASPVTYSVDELPHGLSLDPKSGFVKGKATAPGSMISTFTISNTAGQSVTASVFFVISSPEKPVIVQSVDKLELVYMYDYVAEYPIICSAKSLTYSVNKNLPNNLYYNTTNGAISGKVTASPQAAVDYRFTCTGGNGDSVHKDIPVSIIQTDIPVIVSQNYSVTLTAGQELVNEAFFTVSGKNLVYSISPALPTGIKMDSTSGRFNGYAKSASTNRNYTINVSNGKVSIQLKMSIEVVKSETPVIPPSTLKPNVTVPTGAAVSIQLFEAIGDGLTVSVHPKLPEGFDLYPTGLLVGVVAADVPAKSYDITLTDSNGKQTKVTVILEFTALKCKKDGDFPETIVGEQVVLKCGGGKSGFITRRCIYAGTNAAWEPAIEDCSASVVGPLIGIIIACIIGGGVIFLGGYCIYVRVGGRTKHVRKTAEQMVDASKDAGVRI